MLDDRLKIIKEAQRILKEGGHNCLSWKPYFPRLSEYLPGIIKGVYYLLTANSGVGKTQITKYMFVRCPYDFVKNHAPDLKLKIFYFALEESKDEFIDSLIVAHLAEKYNIKIDQNDLRGYKKILPDHIIKAIEDSKDYFNDLGEYLEIIDTVNNPYGMYKYCKDYTHTIGKHTYIEFKQDKGIKPAIIDYDEYMSLSPKKKQQFRYYRFIQNDPNLYNIAISDHIWLYQKEGRMSKYETLSNFSSEYCRTKLTKQFGFAVANIQQQEAGNEKQQYTMQGKSIYSKIEPSLDALGDIKITQRDALVILGLFAPSRYGIPFYPNNNGYDMKQFGDNFRTLHILKNRIGVPNKKIPLWFDGASNYFEELPKPNTKELIEFLKKKKQ